MSNNMFLKRKRTSFRELIPRLNICLETAEENLYRAKRYVKNLYVNYLAMHAMGDRFKALMYMAEISEAEYMVKLISSICLALEKAIIRLTILSEFYDALSAGSFKGGLEELGSIEISVLSFSLTLIDDVHSSSEDFITSTSFNLSEYRLSFDGLIVKNLAEGFVRRLTEDSIIAS